MKKTITFVVMFIAVIAMITTIHHYTYDNVYYETNKKYETMSLKNFEMAADDIISDDVVVRVKVDYGGNLFETIAGIQKQYLSTVDDNSTNEEIVEARRKMRQAMHEFHLSTNYQRLESIDLTNYESVYVSTYSPYIEYTYKTTDFIEHKNTILSSVSTNRGVESVYITDSDKEYEPQISNAVAHAGMADVIANRTYTGSGIVVGVLEPGIIDKNFVGLEGTNYKIKKQLFQNNTVELHTTYMATCIAGKNGVAPNAKILSICLNGTPVNEIDWMIDNDVDIINMSYSELTPTGIYSSESAYVDYIVYTEKVVVVASAGNESGDGGTGYFSNPGLACNAITVGSTDLVNIQAADFTSHVSAECTSVKPTISIVGEGIRVPDTSISISGTSASAAIVSGISALLLEEKPAYKIFPARLRAYFAAHSKRLDGYEYTSSYPINEYLGAGTLALSNKNKHKTIICSETYCKGSNTDEFFFERAVYLQEGETLRFAVSWNAVATGNVGETIYGDYDLKLVRDGMVVEASNAVKSNVEVLEWTAPSTKLYFLKIKRYGDIINNISTEDTDELSYCYWIDEAEE